MKAIRNITPVAVLLVAITTMLAAGKPLPARLATLAPSVAHANEGPCTLASLKGAYGLQGSGTIPSKLAPNLPPPPYVFGQVGTVVFDGMGNFSASSIQNFGGATVPATETGTYVVNSDCSGTFTINTSLGLLVHDAIVVTDRGQRFITTERTHSLSSIVAGKSWETDCNRKL